MMNFDPSNWYWHVAGDKSRAWSSARAQYVAANDATFQAWLTVPGNRVTDIPSEADLRKCSAASIPQAGPSSRRA